MKFEDYYIVVTKAYGFKPDPWKTFQWFMWEKNLC
jgi:hypothetical protein